MSYHNANVKYMFETQKPGSGRTALGNLISLCKYHHLLVHDRGYLIAAARDGTFAFCRPDGTAIPASPALPDTAGTIEACHDAGITPDTIIPPWYGERLDLDYAIYTCFANAASQASRGPAPQPQYTDQQDPPEPLDWLSKQWPPGQDDGEAGAAGRRGGPGSARVNSTG
jgi:hypothetical protein